MGRVNAIQGVKYLGTSIDNPFQKLLTLENLKAEQWKQEDIKEKIEKIKRGDRVSTFTVKADVLYRSPLRPDEAFQEGSDRIVVPDELVGPVLAYFHLDMHSGAQTLAAMVRSMYFIPGLKAKAVEFTASCHLCLVNTYLNWPPAKLEKNSLFPCRRNDVWSIDVLKGYTANRNKGCMLTMIELATGYTLLAPLVKETAAEIRQIVEERIFTVWGPPKMLLSDSGSNLTRSKSLKQLCRIYKVKAQSTTPNAPRTHGKVEQRNAVVASVIRTLCQQLDKGWTEVCHLAALIINNRPSRTLLNRTPLYMMTGLKPTTTTTTQLIREIEVRDPNQTEQEWDKHVQQVTKILDDYDKQRTMRNERVRGFQTNFIDTFVYAKDYSKRLKPKQRPIYLRQPEYVVNDFGSTVLTKLFDGRILRRHKDNIRPAGIEEVEVYKNVPDTEKIKMGVTLTKEQLIDHLMLQELPSMFHDPKQQYFDVQTRSKTRQAAEAEAAEQEEDEELPMVIWEPQAEDWPEGEPLAQLEPDAEPEAQPQEPVEPVVEPAPPPDQPAERAEEPPANEGQRRVRFPSPETTPFKKTWEFRRRR